MDEKPAKKPRAKTTTPKKKAAHKKTKNEATSHLTEPIAPTQEPWDSEAIKDTITRGLGIPEELATSANESTNTIAPQSISSAPIHPQTDNTREDSAEDRPDAGTAGTTTKADSQTEVEKGGDVPVAVAESDSFPVPESLESVPLARARDGETRGQCWERLRREGRAAGMTRKGAIAYAGGAVDRLFPPPVPVIVAELVDDDENPTFPGVADPKVSPIGDKTESPAAESVRPTVGQTAKSDGQDVSGLSDLPPHWPELPANAQLQVEIAWVTANRLRVRDGTGVNLSRALSPAPSYSALSWLETSILFPSKFADISVKATASQDDEKEFVKREKLAIEEIRGILKEMLDAKTG